MTDYYLNKDKPLSKETLLDDLQKYGNLKLAINNLENRKTVLKSSKRSPHGKQTKNESVTVKNLREKNR
jgi:hypothetical protein